MAVPVQTSGPQFSSGRPAKLYDTKYSGDFYSYDVTPDGLRFLMMKESSVPIVCYALLRKFGTGTGLCERVFRRGHRVCRDRCVIDALLTPQGLSNVVWYRGPLPAD
jgi:hypothetical protein